MDDPEATTLHFSLSKEDASDSISYPTINKQRKSSESKLKLSQICDMSPDPDFRTELVVYDSSKESRSRRKRAMIDDLYDHCKVHSPVIEQAEELRANLEASFPSFWKAMVKSNVTHGFWLHLPMRFCKLHMPKTDTVFTLENESGGEYKVNYISQRTALSGGWKAFCDSNGLNESDVLVFHLIAPLRFKVFIVRANGISNVTAEAKPINSVPLDIDSEAKINDQTEKEKKSKKRAKQLKSPGFIQHDIQNSTLMVLETTNGHVIDQFENGRVDLGPITSEGLQSSESPCNFKEVKSVDNFTILVNDLAIDSELSDHHRTKYYELCSSQNSFLHNHLLKSINCKLAAEIITQTVNIAEAVRACNLSTSRADYEVWDKTLKGFELLGMNVSFLRARLNRLMSFTLESEESMELKRLKEVTVEKSCAEEEMRALELKLLTLKETMGRLDYKVESLKAKAETHALKFQEEVNAPW
ncbi:B3 domain-containing protein Os01g0234100-like isoform X2 [Mangifera indica]|uniref:B3 domain-containing protein Os01g0234100-like isoform X2 n=1 Tax=Mangifera indica TaxID=29780 RepID=UPI001CFB1F9F|nr:B3 domain-containing protein Os01g0234100-like isoform X2 [Mangifera indica]